MPKKLEFKDKNQRKKCWIYTTILSFIFTVFFIIIGILGGKEYDFFGISIISIIVIWEFYKVFKFYLVTEFKSQSEKIQCWVYSLIFGVTIAIILVWLAIISELKFFDMPTSLQALALIPLIFFGSLSKWFHSFSIKPIEIKRNKLRTWFYAGLFSLSFASLLYGATATSKENFHPLFIFFIGLLFFLGFSASFNIEKGKVITKTIKLLCIIFALLTIALWFVLLTVEF